MGAKLFSEAYLWPTTNLLGIALLHAVIPSQKSCSYACLHTYITCGVYWEGSAAYDSLPARAFVIKVWSLDQFGATRPAQELRGVICSFPL